ncbi:MULTISPECIES: YggS family pyridoxal phosphate-dependent enzyme [Halomonadaceae]|jgi:pyridoxal phosphate enzyme (YggS family)|uniref:YggS family pyridoxal phosphate-dependent enzyme n=1 Tax=Halomonadaceae TaxID=28256 RepID=UPI0007337D53|nr:MULTISPECIES: YggS family pyridoxal phosphate-dependent enzyme [Halomonas]KTG25047.1 YggS family pyridoxal phosphate enzyme [Idiomarina sp. H105]MED5558048.1 YggS family pyridoxal phosphate-dependent enzyme [Pseudomonadota bacterium]OAE94553.1 YggS family pyridoxal phosphate enzyme [Idiomarina sp. WRN-38]MCC4287734.1 YggS family pyridoxal phosphate-dependent enzyme [Halomonas meridiana]MCD1652092.1 YggS family pyridoxal phosphate-dependent enzyme [Halomonas axialensis]|tara:strand:+ start:543 stop:1241 length:699 start_codon:yes stop_codon:yes gene_type:complete
MTDNALPESLASARERLRRALEDAGRSPTSATLLAVSKTKPAEMLREAWQHGQREFGENYLQEALDKQAALEDLDGIVWHFIGPLQSNKTRAVAEQFAWVHSVDRLKIAKRLSEQRPAALPPLNVCLQVNISREATKSGVLPEGTLVLAQEIAALPGLALRGLMAIPAPAETLEAQRQPLAALRQLLEELQAALPEAPLDTLSMGMSDDLEAAVLEGATLVRLGTAIFGARG